MDKWSGFRQAESALLELRHAQRGTHTLGDAADHALLLQLAALPRDAESLARDSGAKLGLDVYACRYHEASLAQALALLGECLQASGVGLLQLEHAFHRSARVRYQPAVDLASADPDVRNAFLEGLVSTFLSRSYNCQATTRVLEHDFLEVVLGEGRDINRKPREAA